MPQERIKQANECMSTIVEHVKKRCMIEIQALLRQNIQTSSGFIFHYKRQTQGRWISNCGYHH